MRGFGRYTEVHLIKLGKGAAFWRRGRFRFLYPSMLVLVCLVLARPVRADTISGTVKDPSGAVVAGARVELTGQNAGTSCVHRET